MLKEILLKYKGEIANKLTFNYSPDRILDQEFINSLFMEMTADGRDWESIKVNAHSQDFIPDERGIYMFVWDANIKISSDARTLAINNIVYVGKAENQTIKKRYIQEYKKIIQKDFAVHWGMDCVESRKARLKKYLNLPNLQLWYLVVDDSEKINRFEKNLIQVFCPPANCEFNPTVRATRAKTLPPVKAF